MRSIDSFSVRPAGSDIDHRPGGFKGSKLLGNFLQLLALL